MAMADLLARWPAWLQWTLLAVLSALFGVGMQALHLPAALLLGPMLAGILLGVNGASVRPPKLGYVAAQAVVGCLIASLISAAIIASFTQHWPLLLGATFLTLVMSNGIGVLLGRTRELRGTTAIWGVTPGAATAMVLMAESFGADARMVAFMQYLRVVCVALAAAIVSRVFLHGSNAVAPVTVWFPPLDWPAFLATLTIAGGAAWIATRLRIPAGALLLPAIVAATLHLSGLMPIVLPAWLLAATYAFVGWSIGLGFTRSTLQHALRALPAIVFSIAALMLLCGAMALALTWLTGIDALTAYLATSPGGMDSVAIIAAASHVDVSFVMAAQTVRLIVVVALGPRLARWVALRSGAGEGFGVGS
jgi:uncharacterized protein